VIDNLRRWIDKKQNDNDNGSSFEDIVGDEIEREEIKRFQWTRAEWLRLGKIVENYKTKSTSLGVLADDYVDEVKQKFGLDAAQTFERWRDQEYTLLIKRHEDAAKEYGELYIDQCYEYLRHFDWTWFSKSPEEQYQMLREEMYRYKESVDRRE
jgi:hypothetical protein